MDAFLPDLRLEATRRQALAYSRALPSAAARGVVEIRRWTDRYGKVFYAVEQRSGDGGYSTDGTYDLQVAYLAAELLALANQSRLLRCRECEVDEGAGR